MEVHHHPNHSQTKSWKAYFFEFFMLFFAVFCGFLAEYFLEHRIETDKEKQYMITLVEDLKSDTAEFTRLNNMCNRLEQRMDSVIAFMRPPIAKEKAYKYYLESIGVTMLNSFSYNDRTTEQLKSSGAFRLIQNKSVADSIVAYDNKMRGVFTKNYNVLWNHRLELISMFEDIVDVSKLRHIHFNFEKNIISFDDSSNVDITQLKMLTDDNTKLIKVYNASIDQIFFSMDLSNWIGRMNTKAINLINFIENEYKLN